MSGLLPHVFRDLARTMRMVENQLRMSEDLFHPITSTPSLFGRRMTRPYEVEHEKEVSFVRDKDNFQIKLNVENFAPEEISVKAVDDNCIQIEGKHEEGQDDQGFISRHFVRRYSLPKGVNLKDVVSSLSSDGILTIKTPVKETPIQISYTGPEKDTGKEQKKME